MADCSRATAADLDLAREGIYRFLAAALRAPDSPGAALLRDRACLLAAAEAADLLRASLAGDETRLGFGERPLASLTLRSLLAWLEADGSLGAEHHRVFGLLSSRECPLYETEYYSTDEAFFRAQQLADVAGFYAAFGLTVSRQEPERPDYLPLQLEFMAFLLMKKRLAASDPVQGQVCAEAETTFFRDHLAWWLPSFVTGLHHKAASGPYAALAEFLAAFLPLERERCGLPPPKAPLPVTGAETAEGAAECAGCVS